LIPLPDGEDLLPCADGVMDAIKKQQDNNIKDVDANAAVAKNGDGTHTDGNANKDDKDSNNKNATTMKNDNRNLVDDNTSQKLTSDQLSLMNDSTSTPGSSIVAALISNSSTFESKTVFSQAKYVKRKQLKYQPRCRIVRITPSTLCSAMHLKDSRKISNLREDTLGQILSNANICAGERVLVMDTAVQGIITASCTRRMGGYGSVISLYAGQQPGYLDSVVNKMNFTISEKQSLKWVALGEVFGDYDEKERQMKSMRDETTGKLNDVERRDRDQIAWPAPLQDHTRDYMLNELKEEKRMIEFLSKRSSRFTRKLTRNSMLEMRELVDGCRDAEETFDASTKEKDDMKDDEKDEEKMETTLDESNDNSNSVQQCDSLIIATKYDPTATILRLLPYLAPSCPFVIYHEFLEPLLDTFHTLQNYYQPEDSNETGEKNANAATTKSTTNNNTKEKKTPMMQRRNIAVNLRLTDTWFREYQVLEGRTHPNMVMSQNGGYILMGTKLCPRTGTNELDESARQEIRDKLGGWRKRCRGGKRNNENDGAGDDGSKKKKKKGDGKRVDKK